MTMNTMAIDVTNNCIERLAAIITEAGDNELTDEQIAVYEMYEALLSEARILAEYEMNVDGITLSSVLAQNVAKARFNNELSMFRNERGWWAVFGTPGDIKLITKHVEPAPSPEAACHALIKRVTLVLVA